MIGVALVVAAFLVFASLRPPEAENYWLRPLRQQAESHGATVPSSLNHAIDELGRVYDSIGGNNGSATIPGELIPLTDWALFQATGPNAAQLASFRGAYLELRARMGWIGTTDTQQDDPLPVLTLALEQSGVDIPRRFDDAGAIEVLAIALRNGPDLKAQFAPDGYLDVRAVLVHAGTVTPENPNYGLFVPYQSRYNNLAKRVRIPPSFATSTTSTTFTTSTIAALALTTPIRARARRRTRR